jgi:hypothetical protein
MIWTFFLLVIVWRYEKDYGCSEKDQKVEISNEEYFLGRN